MRSMAWEMAVERLAALLVVGIDQLDRRLGVGLGVEAVAGLGELFPDLLIVFDDAVVHQHHREVVAVVRVGVELAGFAVGGPAGVADAAKSWDGAAAVGLFQKGLEAALGFDDADLGVGGTVFPDGDAGGVVAPVFQLFKPPQQDGGCLFFTDVTCNSTHE